MTDAERKMVLYLIYDGGADLCQKCVHLGKPTCGTYVSPDDFSGECDDDYCIEGMVKHFEEQEKRKAVQEYKIRVAEALLDFTRTLYGIDNTPHEAVDLSDILEVMKMVFEVEL